MKIAITGGHITPALAVIDELKRKNEKIKITYFGRKYSFEGDKTFSNDYQIVSKIQGIKYVDLETGRLQRKFSRYTIPSLLKVPHGFLQAYKELKSDKPDLIFSFGGYLAVPVVIVGFFLKIPIITHEQTVVIGFSNRIIAFFAKKILVSFEKSLKYFPKKKAVLTGNPIRKELFNYQKVKLSSFPKPLDSIIQEKIDNNKKKIIYVTGGNQGSQIINKLIWELLPELLKNYSVIHQCGFKDWEAIRNGKIVIEPSEHYYVSPWIDTKEIGLILNAADLVISRAGANTVYELGVLGKPSILIPIPWVVNSEQQKNAEILSDAGFARILSENNLKPWKLKTVIDEMFTNIEEYQNVGAEFKTQLKIDAASVIVSEVENIIKPV